MIFAPMLRQARALGGLERADRKSPRVHGTHGEVVALRAERDRGALLGLPRWPYLVVARSQRLVACDGFFSFEGRRYAVPGARPGERVELLVGARKSLTSTQHLTAVGSPATSGVGPRVLGDPRRGSVALARVLGALPEIEVHQRPLSVYEEAL